MANKEAPAKVAKTIPGNPAHIVWPAVPSGMTTLMRKEGVRAAGRIGPDDEKLEQFLSDLRILAGHATARHADRKVERSVRMKALAKQEAEEAHRIANAEADRIAGIRVQAAALIAEADAAEGVEPKEAE